MTATGHTPFEVGARDRVVGLFVIGALLLFLIGFLIPFVHRLNAEEGIPFYTVLDQTYGIGVEASVSMRGVPIGNVTAVSMTTEGMVRVDFKLSPAYQPFYAEGSRLAVDTELGVSTLLTGSGLIFQPANQDNGVMDPGTFIPADTPKGISSILEEIDIIMLTDQVTEIVANVEEITRGMNQNQDKIYRSIDNLETVTASLAEVSRTLPGMVASVETSLTSLQGSMAGINELIANTDDDLQATLENTVTLTHQASLTLAEAETLMRESAPAIRQLPITLISVDLALQSMTQLTDQMNRSWLFGGETIAPTVTVGPPRHAYDDEVYRQNPEPTEVTNEQQ